MTRRNFFRRLAGGLAAICGAKAAAPVMRPVSTQGATTYTGPPLPAVRLQAKRLACVVPLPPELLDAGWLTLDEVRAQENLA